MQDWTGLVILALVAVPVILVVRYLRKPYESGSVPRDSVSMKAKGETRRPLGVLPGDAFDAKIRDNAADQPEQRHKHRST